MKRARIPTVQVPILTVVLVVAAIAFLIRGSLEMSRLLRWWDDRMLVQRYRAEILRAKSVGLLKNEHFMRMTRFVERAERDRPGTSNVLCLIGCAIGTLVATVATARTLGGFLIVAILRRRGFEPGAISRASDGSGFWFYTRGSLGQVKVHLVKDGEDRPSRGQI